MKQKTIVLLSSGIDSAVNLALSSQKDRPVLALTFDYGQAAGKRELVYAGKLAEYYRVPHRVIKLDWYKELAKLAHQQEDFTMPVFDAEKQAAKTVWMPNRNGLFINIAACFAEALGAQTILFGGNAEEAESFPDNSHHFVRSANKALSLSARREVKLKSYTISMQKTEIVREAQKLGLPFKFVWSCYHDGNRMCGQCESCLRLKRGAGESGIDIAHFNF